jgi:hypothetical protein
MSVEKKVLTSDDREMKVGKEDLALFGFVDDDDASHKDLAVKEDTFLLPTRTWKKLSHP